MTSRRARERANARPWEQDPEPDDHQHAGDFPERDDDEQPERFPNTDDIKQDYGNYHSAITSGWHQIWLELWRCTFWRKPTSADTRKDGAFTSAASGMDPRVSATPV